MIIPNASNAHNYCPKTKETNHISRNEAIVLIPTTGLAPGHTGSIARCPGLVLNREPDVLVILRLQRYTQGSIESFHVIRIAVASFDQCTASAREDISLPCTSHDFTECVCLRVVLGPSLLENDSVPWTCIELTSGSGIDGGSGAASTCCCVSSGCNVVFSSRRG